MSPLRTSWFKLPFFPRFLSELAEFPFDPLFPLAILTELSYFFRASMSYLAVFMSDMSKLMSLVFYVVKAYPLVIRSLSSLIYFWIWSR